MSFNLFLILRGFHSTLLEEAYSVPEGRNRLSKSDGGMIDDKLSRTFAAQMSALKEYRSSKR